VHNMQLIGRWQEVKLRRQNPTVLEDAFEAALCLFPAVAITWTMYLLWPSFNAGTSTLRLVCVVVLVFLVAAEFCLRLSGLVLLGFMEGSVRNTVLDGLKNQRYSKADK
jgi:hypothetical protein